MWSDRLSPERRRSLVDTLRQVLPPPRPSARSQSFELRGNPEPCAVAQALWTEPDFVWLDRPGQAQFAKQAIARLSLTNGTALVSGPHGELTIPANGFDLIGAALEAWGSAGDAQLYGYLGYELGSQLEDVPQPPSQAGDPSDLHFALYDWRLEQTTTGWLVRGTDAWREPAIEDLSFAAPAAPELRFGRLPPMTSTPSPGGFCEAVSRTVARITNGELFQVNLCRRLETAFPPEAILPFYLRLRAINPADYAALIRTRGGAVLSVSPELYLSVADGVVRSRPIKGTRPRGTDREQDRLLAAGLTGSEKDRAELAMIVDVVRNDLGRVCRAGSVAVTKHAELMSLPTVHHTFSEVTGRLRTDCGVEDLLRASFPPASITGAPKIHAMEIAALEEGYRRGPCMGSIGWISLDGGLELSVAIRTAVAARGRIWYVAGCGITVESVPAEELAESEHKAAAFYRVLEEFSA